MIIKSRDIEHATSVIVTHQVRDALYIATHTAVADGTAIRIVPSGNRDIVARFMFLREGSIVFQGSPDGLRASRDPAIRQFIKDAADPPWLRTRLHGKTQDAASTHADGLICNRTWQEAR